jgi:hypothetical protein
MSGTVHPAAPLDDVVSDDADTMIHFKHPARAEEFAAVAVLATLAYSADETGSALPPLWPMVLHSSFTDLILPVPGAAADAWSSDAASIPELIRALHSLIHRHQHRGALGIRRVLYLRRDDALIDDALIDDMYSRRKALIDAIIASGVVPLLAWLLGSGTAPHATQFEAAWVLAIVAASNKSTHVQCVANEPGAIQGIVSLFGFADHHDAWEHAVQALGSIAGKSSIARDLLLESGVIAAILNVVSQTDLPMSLRRIVAGTISQLFCTKPPLATIAAAIPFLIEVSQSPDDGYATASAGMQGLLSITSGGDCDGISAVIEHGALPAILRRLSSANNTIDIIDEFTLHCLDNIVEGNERHIAQAVEHGAIPALCTMWRRLWPATISSPMSCTSWGRSPPATWIISTRCCRPVPST